MDGRIVHGLSRTSEYNTWSEMRRRCQYKQHRLYPSYGGRGITVCRRWDRSFLAFLKDMGPRPPGFILDRINNDESYRKSNCRWTDRTTSQRNRRTTVYATFRGKRLPAAELADRFGLHPHVVADRVRLGWSGERAIAERLVRPGRRMTELRYRGRLVGVDRLVSVANVPQGTLLRRVRNGWPIEEAVETPPRANH